MLRMICLCIALLFVGLYEEAKAQAKQQDSVLVLYDGWAMSVPKGFTCKGGYSIDSYMGNIFSLKDSLELQFDVSTNLVVKPEYQFDNCLERMSAVAKLFLSSDSLVQALGVTNTSHAYIDTVNGKIAVIVVPQNIGKGETRIIVIDCPSISSLSLTGKDLNAVQQELVLTMFKTINRLKRSD